MKSTKREVILNPISSNEEIIWHGKSKPNYSRALELLNNNDEVKEDTRCDKSDASSAPHQTNSPSRVTLTKIENRRDEDR
ncbi:hypothetical protein QL285_074069 [Trifolium repens]|nr:hypothetical protein QL285_074069 [Trifolium repens]